MKTWLALWLALLLAACAKAPESAYEPTFSSRHDDGTTEFVVGVLPVHNPARLTEVYGPIVDYLDTHVPKAQFRLEASRNYEEFDKKLKAGEFDFAMPNPYQTLVAVRHGYRIFGKMGDDDDFRGVILVRRDSGIRSVTDLRGKTVCYPAATAVAATMMPQYYLQTHGLDVNTEITTLYVGSQESAIINVVRGRAAAGAAWLVPWKAFTAEHPEMARELEVRWQTEALPNNGWVVRQNVPAPVAERVAALLFSLHQSDAGRKMLARIPVSRFEPADEETYRKTRDFLEKFSRTIRPLEQ